MLLETPFLLSCFPSIIIMSEGAIPTEAGTIEIDPSITISTRKGHISVLVPFSSKTPTEIRSPQKEHAGMCQVTGNTARKRTLSSSSLRSLSHNPIRCNIDEDITGFAVMKADPN
jgi:hypothetical protein